MMCHKWIRKHNKLPFSPNIATVFQTNYGKEYNIKKIKKKPKAHPKQIKFNKLLKQKAISYTWKNQKILKFFQEIC